MNKPSLNILLLSAECRSLAKVGGLGDVVYDLAHQLSNRGHKVKLIIPAYQALGLTGKEIAQFSLFFGGKPTKIRLLKTDQKDWDIYLLDGEYFQGAWGEVYIDSEVSKGPFYDDALRFAFYCRAVIELLQNLEDFKATDLIHCHDWHTGLIPLLLKINKMPHPTVFTIHNLDYQGIRPLDGSYVALGGLYQWFPELVPTFSQMPEFAQCCDTRYQDCFNPMRTGINLSSAVNTVSPTYAQEICKADKPEANFAGGRGLEQDLLRRKKQKRLLGILNGMDYEAFDPQKNDQPFHQDVPDLLARKQEVKQVFLSRLPQELKELQNALKGKFKNSQAVFQNLPVFLKAAEGLPLAVAVTRVVDQKFGLFLKKDNQGSSLAKKFIEKKVALLVIGTGELEKELDFLNTLPNALFLNMFSPSLANKVYAAGDFFLMPSDFEPCGLSQLMAMRFGCLPFVNDRGGLHDTVTQGKTGFVFSGKTVKNIQENFLKTTDKILKLWTKPEEWVLLVKQAMEQRYDWEESVKAYENLYLLLCKQA